MIVGGMLTEEEGRYFVHRNSKYKGSEKRGIAAYTKWYKYFSTSVAQRAS